jgi:hypothetical protein
MERSGQQGCSISCSAATPSELAKAFNRIRDRGLRRAVVEVLANLRGVEKPERRRVHLRDAQGERTEHNLDLEFNSLDDQREACEAYIKSQAHEGWRLVPDRYDDGGLSGASLNRPALQALLTDISAGKIDIVVVYKVDRLTRSLADFAKLVELFDQHAVSFGGGSRSMSCCPSPSSNAR